MPQLVQTFEQAMQLPTAAYRPARRLREKHQGLFVEMGASAMTHPGSYLPMLGAGFDPCIALILDNRDEKRTLIHHDSISTVGAHLEDFSRAVRASSDEELRVHVVGASRAVRPSVAGYNKDIVDSLRALFLNITALPNLSLQTFDVYDKFKPNAVAIHSDNGLLFRDSQLYRTYEAGLHTERSHDHGQFNNFCDFEIVQYDEFFDATKPEYDKA